ncbi:MAG: hypothetical protein SXQ77_09660, partial [Halobacteria archaeon]|nr:hypothetical protein [Halobacteria archaeon]
MAYFSTSSPATCSDCGETVERGVSTDLFADNDIQPSPELASVYCFDCYLDSLDSVYYEVKYVIKYAV